LIETARLNRASREERRRAEALTRCAQALHSKLELDSVGEELVRSVAEMLLARASGLLLFVNNEFRLVAVYSADPNCAQAIRDHHASGTCSAAGDLARRAVAAQGPVTMTPGLITEPEAHVGERRMIATPLFTNSSTAVLLVCPPENREFDEQELSLLKTVAGFGSMAVSNAELLAKSEAQARELQQLLSITSELSNTDDLDRFLERFVLCAAEFLGFARSCIALVDSDGSCTVLWAAESGVAGPMIIAVPARIQKHVIESKKVFWTDDAQKLPNPDVEFAEKYHLKQGLVAPLLGSQGQCLGLLAGMDRKDGNPIQQEDIRRAEALAAAVAAVLERIRNLHLAVQHRQRSENLVGLALEVGTSIRLPQLARALTERAAGLIRAESAALLLARGTSLETVYVSNAKKLEDKALAHRLNICLTDLMARSKEPIRFAPAVELLGPSIAELAEWSDVAVVRLSSANDELIGVLCLANIARDLTAEDNSILQ